MNGNNINQNNIKDPNRNFPPDVKIKQNICLEPQDYNNVIQLVVHSDNLTWQRFYYFLVFNSIFLLVWATIFSSNSNDWIKSCLLIFFSLIGLLVSVLWGPIAIRRGRIYQDYYMAWARQIERNRPSECDIFTKQVDLTEGFKIHFLGDATGAGHDKKGDYSKYQIPEKSLKVGARQMMEFICWIFVGLYTLLFIWSYYFLSTLFLFTIIIPNAINFIKDLSYYI